MFTKKLIDLLKEVETLRLPSVIVIVDDFNVNVLLDSSISFQIKYVN